MDKFPIYYDEMKSNLLASVNSAHDCGIPFCVIEDALAQIYEQVRKASVAEKELILSESISSDEDGRCERDE